MVKLEKLLGLSSVSATLFKFGIRVHGQTVACFAALIALNDKLLNKQITLLSSATLEFLETGSRLAGGSAWKSIRSLEGAINQLPATEQASALYHLERYVQMLLARDADLASLIVKDIEDYRILRLQRLAELASARPSKASAVIGQWVAALRKEGGDLLTIFKRFKAVVSLDSPAVIKASAYIRDHVDSIKEAIKAAKAGNKAKLLGHLSSVRGYLGEAYALLSPVWRKLHYRELKKARKLAREMGPDYEVLPLSQLENNIRLSQKESADQMIVIINRKRKEAITYLSAQVKTADTSEAVRQTINDVIKRELAPAGLLEFEHEGKPFALTLIQHDLVTAQRYILNAAESRIPGSDLDLLNVYGVQISEIVLDMSVSQLSRLSIWMIEEGLKVVK